MRHSPLIAVPRLAAAAALALTAALPAAAGEPRPLDPGASVDAFALRDAGGVERSLERMLDEAQFVIVDFWSTKCPVSKAYEDRLKAIAEEYAGRGVRVLAIMSNQTEDAQDIRDYLEKTPLPYTIVLDPDSAIADRFGAQTTPHVFVLDRERTIRYAGGIDNGSRKPADLKPYLRQALDALLAGKSPPEAKTRNFGCSIKRKS